MIHLYEEKGEKFASEMAAPALLMGQGGEELFWGYSWVRETAQHMSKAAHGRTGG
jgi:asparagine synthetase B (glutamine-hydrolysing)